MDDRNRIIMLYDYYQNLLTTKQKKNFESYYFDNLSLGEISEIFEVSRNAAHKVIKNTKDKLDFYEDKLNLYEKRVKVAKLVNEVKDEQIKKQIKKIMDEI